MSSAALPPGSISLAELAALNDEIAALVRAGVPLEHGLAGAARDLPGRLGSCLADLSQRMERGESLAQAVAGSRGVFPPVYQAVIEAGLKAGHLPVALEGLATAARRLAEVRRVVLLAMLYPIIVLLVAYAMFIVYVVSALPALLNLFGRHPPWLVRALVEFRGVIGLWVFAVPIVILAVVFYWRYRTGRAMAVQSERLFVWLPSVGRMMHSARIATLSEVLALLLEHGVPLHEAVVLAAEAAGDHGLTASARELATSLERGALPSDNGLCFRGFPPLLRWLAVTGAANNTLVPLLRSSADAYRRRALRQADWVRIYLPIILTVAIGGVATLLYTMACWIPMVELLEHLSRPVVK